MQWQVGDLQYPDASAKSSLKALVCKPGQRGAGLETSAFPEGLNKHELVRPPSRHKDPTQNLGLEEFPDCIATKQSELKQLKGGFFSQEIGETFMELPLEGFEGDIEGEAAPAKLKTAKSEQDLDGNNEGPAKKLPTKKFKEDEDFEEIIELPKTGKQNAF